MFTPNVVPSDIADLYKYWRVTHIRRIRFYFEPLPHQQPPHRMRSQRGTDAEADDVQRRMGLYVPLSRPFFVFVSTFVSFLCSTALLCDKDYECVCLFVCLSVCLSLSLVLLCISTVSIYIYACPSLCLFSYPYFSVYLWLCLCLCFSCCLCVFLYGFLRLPPAMLSERWSWTAGRIPRGNWLVISLISRGLCIYHSTLISAIRLLIRARCSSKEPEAGADNRSGETKNGREALRRNETKKEKERWGERKRKRKNNMERWKQGKKEIRGRKHTGNKIKVETKERHKRRDRGKELNSAAGVRRECRGRE